MSKEEIKDYLELENITKQIFQINNAINILSWDKDSNTPKNSTESRKNEITNLSSIAHSMLKSSKVAELIKNAYESSSKLGIWQLANLREIERRYIHAECIDDDLQKRYVNSASQCQLVWQEAKKDDDYTILKPSLQEVLNSVKEIASAKSEKLKITKYDALLDKFDPDVESKNIKDAYTVLKKEIPILMQEIIEKQKSEVVLPFPAKVSLAQQRIIGKRIMEVIGFDFTRGRIDESAHPFCGGTPHDVRLTTRYDDNFINNMMNIIHETGHGLYEQSLPVVYRDQPVGKAKGMAIHESQALFMEMQVGRSREFIEFFSKLLKDEFSFSGSEYSAENIYKSVTRVKPGFIRIDADEVTYVMHVILRFEIEEALINDELNLDDLPNYWNNKMQEYLGITPESNKTGCMQDIHWPKGYYGYFPVYTSGAIIASMLMKKIKFLNPNISQELSNGQFSQVNNYLNQNIRIFGSIKSAEELISNSTDEDKISPLIFLSYLRQKYIN